MTQSTYKLWLPLIALGCFWSNENAATAQQPAPAQSNSAAASTDDAQKYAILSSDRWKHLQSEFHAWLSVQVILTPTQVEQMKKKLNAEVKLMSASELEQFMNQWDAKLQVLAGSDAAEAREWLAQNLVVMADGFRKQFLAGLGLTNVTDMSAAQIEQKILEIRAKQNSRQQQNAVFNQSRQQTVQNVERIQAQWQQQAQQAAKNQGTAATFNSFQSQYSPRSQPNSPQRFVPAYGRPFGGLGWGFFW